MATPTLTSRSTPAPDRPAAAVPAGAAGSPAARVLALVRLAADAVDVGLAAMALLGAAVLVATLLDGRTALFWPSRLWAASAAAVALAGLALWWLNAQLDRGPDGIPGSPGFARGTPDIGYQASAFRRPLAAASAWRRLHVAGWPLLALLPAALAAAALYADDASNHVAATYLPAKQSLLAYAGALFGLAEASYLAIMLLRRRRTPAGAGVSSIPPLALAVATAAYLNGSVYLQWIPRQTDLRVNLDGARDLFAGVLPYHDNIPVWADRVHLLPATLVLLFGPLILLPDAAARVLFFLGNQALWLAAMWLLVKALAPAGQRPLWAAGVLVFGALYWPWQESIRFGQQDGLLILLFVLSFLAAARARHTAAGLALGAALIVKPLSLWLPLIYVLHLRWRTLFVAAAAAAALALVTLPITGLAPWWHFLRVELPEMLPGTVRGTNIPLPSLHARLFVGREALSNGDPAPTLAVISALNLGVNILGLLLVGRLALASLAPGDAGSRRRDWLLDASIGLALTLLLAPMAWQHYASWLAPVFFILASPLGWRPLAPAARAGVAVLAGAGFLLLSLEDGRLVSLLSPLLDRWPAVLAFYPAGLLCVTAALVLARFAAAPLPAPAVAAPLSGRATADDVGGAPGPLSPDDH